MCGVTGCLRPAGVDSYDILASWANDAADTLYHRGPDDHGIWVDVDAGVALAHRRLSIIDLSQQGHQPMVSEDGRFILAYNGETYNSPTLRAELEAAGTNFRGHSDTEVLLEAISHWGLMKALQRANGMFALALWDRRNRQLHLARDRFGQKPLYYGWGRNSIVFGSELKALHCFPDFTTDIDRDAIALLLRHSHIPAPYTIYRNCWKLMPSTVLTLSAESLEKRTMPQPVAYWSALETAQKALSDPLTVPKQEAVDELDLILGDAVRACTISDAPLGGFLSGGIDSSIIVALMQSQSNRNIKTFSIGFTEDSHNEAPAAKAIAHHLGTNHTELYVTPAEAQEVIPKLSEIYNEPFADASQIPTHLVSKLARKYVTVSLSGDGGDELFGGYNRYTWSQTLKHIIDLVPTHIRCWGGRRAVNLSPQHWDRLYSTLSSIIPPRMRKTQVGDKIHKLAEIIGAPTREEMYWRLTSQWKNPAGILLQSNEQPTRLSQRCDWPVLPTFTQQMMMLDTLVYLPDDILVKLDRASMAVSLEGRVPFLDHRLFEFAWRIPNKLKIRNGQGKQILRSVLEKYVPRKLFERPKMGFGVPIGDWLRKDLRAWADDLLSENTLRQQGYFQPEVMQKIWQCHLSGQRNYQHMLWPILMFQAWMQDRG